MKGSGLVGLAPTPAEGDEEIKDPLNKGVAGFVAQLKKNKFFNDNFDSVFSIYLSNREAESGNIIFGGYDLAKFAKSGASDKDIIWTDQSANEAYWAVNTKNVMFGKHSLAATN